MSKIPIVLILCVLGYPVFAQECRPLGDETRRNIEAYISKRLELPVQTKLVVTQEELVEQTCFRKLILEGDRLEKPLTVYLSPDQHYLSTSLFDLSVDPSAERQAEAEQANKALLADASPSRGSADAPVVVVEFADFQCPYCKQFADWMSSIPDDMRSRVRLVFKEFPLPMHPWAKDAALIGTCAGLYSSDAFWMFHDFFFREQQHLSSANILQRSGRVADSIPGYSASRLFACVDSEQAVSATAKDKELGARLNVDATPTIFINGHRGNGINSAEDLKLQLQKAFENATKQH